MKLISLIIPIFNMDKYLSKCLNSIIEQLSEKEELILIDDGSTDRTLEICEKYAKSYKEIKLIHQENKGVAEARNRGMFEASGEYIAWIDSDDWISSIYLDEIRTIINKDRVDIVIFNYCKIREEKKKYLFYKKEEGYLKKEEVLLDIATDVRLPSSLWRIVARKDLYEKLFFPKNVQMMEDFYIFHFLFHRANSIYYLNKTLYFYRVRKNSLSHTKKQDIFQRYYISLERKNFYKKYYPEIEEKYSFIPVLLNACSVLQEINDNDKMFFDLLKLIRKYILKLLLEKAIPAKCKIQLILCAINPFWAKKIKQIVWKYDLLKE